jgi:hypothetical protein
MAFAPFKFKRLTMSIRSKFVDGRMLTSRGFTAARQARMKDEATAAGG